jgi:dTMP kinase
MFCVSAVLCWVSGHWALWHARCHYRPQAVCYHAAVSLPPKRGKFITIEGLDGCGKTTQLNRLAKALRARGFETVVTREPGGTTIGEKVRAVLLDSATSDLSPWGELALMFASRAQHIDELILPSLAAGKFVLCDRFTDSSEAYQGGGRKLGSEPVLQLHRILCHGIQPDLTILMDSEVSASVERARRRNLQRTARIGNSGSKEQDENRFEQEGRAFFDRVHQKYLEIARREPQRVFLVDARRPADLVSGEILAEVKSRFVICNL